MSTSVLCLGVLALLCFWCLAESDDATNFPQHSPRMPSQPHILLMLIDDMGWYNAPWNGNPEIQQRMPHLWNMSRHGLILDRHYSFKYCSPARSSLMSGRLPFHVTQNNDNNIVTNPGGADLRMTLLPQRLKQVGNYSTSLVGKWHVGARSRANLPTHRGFDHHFGFLKGGEDHFTQINVDTNNVEFVDLWSQEAPAYGRNGTYSTYLYADEAVRVIQRHSSSNRINDEQRPLFMYLSWQAMHGPLEAPREYHLPLPNDPRGARSQMNAMAAILDEGIRNVTNALRRAGMYDNTLIVVSSDNGGWIQLDRGGNNFPLRGGKVSDFEGGVRTAAFVGGGYLERQAPHLVGTKSQLLMHLVDWYSTLIGLGASSAANNVMDWYDESGGVPPVDSMDVWEALISQPRNVTAVRKELPLSFCTPEASCDFPGGVGNGALIVWPWKIINGTQAGLGLWQGPIFPNASRRIPQPGPDLGCPNGCLFNIKLDPTEHRDLKDIFPEMFNWLWSKLLDVRDGVYQTNYDGGASTCLSVKMAYKRDRGFLAPRCYREEKYMPPDTEVEMFLHGGLL
ncbi:sulfatase [Nitzschia inconspicua]|uniref:Sulfatase n=1 Tax=Nitzschia inconspicua TaxID=303405 RepID=A0A9K3Q5S9_9STRA|nr:sulfatase [Nitzschia inconspicua]